MVHTSAPLPQDELRDAVLLVFANKQDLPNAMNAAEITDKLGLHSLRQRHWCVGSREQTLCCLVAVLLGSVPAAGGLRLKGLFWPLRWLVPLCQLPH